MSVDIFYFNEILKDQDVTTISLVILSPSALRSLGEGRDIIQNHYALRGYFRMQKRKILLWAAFTEKFFPVSQNQRMDKKLILVN